MDRVVGGVRAGGRAKKVTNDEAARIYVSLPTAAAGVAAGNATTLTVTLRRTNYTGAVSLAVTGGPTGVTPTLSAATLSGSTLTATLTLTADAAASTGAGVVTVTATGAGVTAATCALHVACTAAASASFALQLVPIADGTSTRRFVAQSLPLPPSVTAADLATAVVTVGGTERAIYIADTGARHTSAGNTDKVQAVTLEVETAIADADAVTSAVLTFGGTPTLGRLTPVGYDPHTNTLDVGLSADGKYPTLNSALRIQHANESCPRTIPAGTGTYYDAATVVSAPSSGYRAVTFLLTVETGSSAFKARYVREVDVAAVADVNQANAWSLDTNCWNASGALAGGALAGGYGQTTQIIAVWTVCIPAGAGTVTFGTTNLTTAGIVADQTGGTHEPLSLMFDQLPKGLVTLADAADLAASEITFYETRTAAEHTAAGGDRATWESLREQASFYFWRAAAIGAERWTGARYFLGETEYARHVATADARHLVKALAWARVGFAFGSANRYDDPVTGTGTHNAGEQNHDCSTTAFWWAHTGDPDALQRTKENITRRGADMIGEPIGYQNSIGNTLRVHMHWFATMKYALRYGLDVGTVPAITRAGLADTIDASLRTATDALGMYRRQVAIFRAQQLTTAAAYPDDAGLITQGAYGDAAQGFDGDTDRGFGPFMAGDLLGHIGLCERIVEAHHGGATDNARNLILDCLTFVTERAGIPTADPLMIDDYLGATEQFYYTRAAAVQGPTASGDAGSTNLNGCWGGAFAYAVRVDGNPKWQTLFDRFVGTMCDAGGFWYTNQTKSYAHTCYSTGAYFGAIS